MPSKTERFIVRFTGNVQGVGFRMTCLREAMGLDINGFVRNELDGSVILDVDATERDAKNLIDRIQTARKEYLDATTVVQQESLDRSAGMQIMH